MKLKNLHEGFTLQSNRKLFADDTLFSVIEDPHRTAEQLNNLRSLSRLVFQWKMCLNPDPSK